MAEMIEIVCDVESTGLSTQYDQILEFAYLKINPKCEILGSGTLYFWQDGWKINQGAYEVHGLTEEFLAPYAKDFDKNLATLYTILFNSVIIGKNSKSFDNRMLESFISRHVPPEMLDCQIMGYFDIQDKTTPLFQDWWYRKYKEPTRKKGTLKELCDVLGITSDGIKKVMDAVAGPSAYRQGYHSAMFDTVATYLLVQWLVDTGRANLEY
jgi:DNA polymerase III epsilon subunit-like protein